VAQADEALSILYTKMYPSPWVGSWAVPSGLETRSPIQRPPVERRILDERFKGRRDEGAMPEMAAGILDGMRVMLREVSSVYVGDYLDELGTKPEASVNY
jgi:hypothetical protein